MTDVKIVWGREHEGPMLPPSIPSGGRTRAIGEFCTQRSVPDSLPKDAFSRLGSSLRAQSSTRSSPASTPPNTPELLCLLNCREIGAAAVKDDPDIVMPPLNLDYDYGRKEVLAAGGGGLGLEDMPAGATLQILSNLVASELGRVECVSKSVCFPDESPGNLGPSLAEEAAACIVRSEKGS